MVKNLVQKKKKRIGRFLVDTSRAEYGKVESRL